MLDPARTHHGRYADFVADPMGSVRATYDGVGLELTPGRRAAHGAHLAARPKGHKGEHRYSFDDLGLDRDRRARPLRPLPHALRRARGRLEAR